MTPHLDDNACIDILSGALSHEEAGRLLDHARDCPQCEARFRALASEYETLTAGATDALAGAAGTGRTTPLPRPRRLRRIVIAAGAVAAAVVIGLLVWPSSDHPEYWLPRAAESIEIRSGADGSDERFASGLAAYDARNLDAALRALETARVTGPYEDIRRIYLASALTLSDRAGEALAALEPVEEKNLPQPWRSQAMWIRYLALDRAGSEAEAMELLEEIAAGSGDIAARAAARLDRLRGRMR